jgi:hypothetical protein
MLLKTTKQSSLRDDSINISYLVPGRHYEFVIKSFTAFSGLLIPSGVKRREFIEMMEIGPYRFVKVSREGGIRHLLAVDHIQRIRAIGVVINSNSLQRVENLHNRTLKS